MPSDKWRDYRLVTELGMSPAEIDQTPAERLDWLLAVHDVHVQVKAEAQNKDKPRGR